MKDKSAKHLFWPSYLIESNKIEILKKALQVANFNKTFAEKPFGKGNAADKIASFLNKL